MLTNGWYNNCLKTPFGKISRAILLWQNLAPANISGYIYILGRFDDIQQPINQDGVYYVCESIQLVKA